MDKRRLGLLAAEDVHVLEQKDKEYQGSWKKRGGVGAFMMLARKWDRIEAQAEQHGYDVFALIAADARDEGILDDIRDLRRYLLLVDEHCSNEAQETVDLLNPEGADLFWHPRHCDGCVHCTGKFIRQGTEDERGGFFYEAR